jgi:serine/threonine protein kinase
MASIEPLNWSLQQYWIGHLIASGHFGTVYQARHTPTGRDVALKLIPLQGPDSEEKVAAERHGAVLQQRFGAAHAGLVPEVFEHQTISPFYAIAMELVQGRQLTTLIAEGPIPPRQAAEIALAIARFLEKAHRFETDIEGQHYALIVHADLKPDHILLLDGGGIRVLDFGIAKALAARTLVTTNKWGSVQYASPERLDSDGQVNEHADFWSLGVMLFEMLAGSRPYRSYEHNPGLLDRAIRRQEPRDPLPPTVDPALVAIVGKLLAPQPERRYQHADAIVSDLDAFLNGAPTTAGLEQAHASQETVRLAPVPRTATVPVRPSATQSVPTEPLARTVPPPVPSPAETTAPPTTPSSPPAASTTRRPNQLTRTLRAIAIALVLFTIAGEARSLMRAQRLKPSIPLLEVSGIESMQEKYEQLGSLAPFALGKTSVSTPLITRLTALADRSIIEYRDGRVNEAQWQQALAALDFATTVKPASTEVASRRAYVQGQLARINKRSREAITLFRESARLDSRSFDPYLALATVYAYDTHDVTALTQAIADAEHRGYKQGGREHIELGDLYRFLADQERGDASHLTGSERFEQLQHAAADYTHCIEYLDGVRLFNSEANLRICRKRLSDVEAELPPPPPATSLTDDVLGVVGRVIKEKIQQHQQAP